MISTHDLPEPLHVKALSAEARAQIEMNLDWKSALTQISKDVQSKRTQLHAVARGKNRELVLGLCDSFTTRLDTLCLEAHTKSAEELQVATLALKAAFFEDLSKLSKGDGSYYSEYLRKFSSECMQGLSTAYNKILRKLGVEGVKDSTRAQALSTLPKGFFRSEV